MSSKGKAAIDQPTAESRIAALEQRVTALEQSSRATEGSGTPSSIYTNGMTTPDELGRVKLEAIELERAMRGDFYKSKNAELPAFAYVRAAETTFALDKKQHDHVLMNTDENAIMRKGRAVHVVVDDAGNYHEGDTMLDTIACYYAAPDQAAEEILRKHKALAAGSPDGLPFTPGG